MDRSAAMRMLAGLAMLAGWAFNLSHATSLGGAATASSTHGAQLHSAAGATRDLLAATFPSSLSNGSASATFPATAFAAWCAADSACTAAGSFGIALPYYVDASPFTSVTLNWPNVFSGAGVSSITLASGVVEVQPSGFAAKANQPICSTASPCTAQLVVPLSAAADSAKTSVCIRLEPNVLGTGYQAYGFPANSSGTVVVGIITNGALRCNTTKFGKHVIMQYNQAPLVPPSPPVASPPPSPPYPPPLNSGSVMQSEVKLRVTLVLAISFDTLKNDSALLANLTTSLETSLTQSLASRVPELLLLSSAATSTGSIRKISRYSLDPQNAVTVEFIVTVPAGATALQIGGLRGLIQRSTSTIFEGVSYLNLLLVPAKADVITTEDKGLSGGVVVLIVLLAIVGFALLVVGIVAIVRWRAYVRILPKKPDEYDTYGAAMLQPRTGVRRRKERVKPAGNAVEADPMAPPGVMGAPWGGAGAGAGAAPGGGGDGGGSGAADGAAAGGSGKGGVKSEAELMPYVASKEAWGT